jgi:hypothetical protein
MDFSLVYDLTRTMKIFFFVSGASSNASVGSVRSVSKNKSFALKSPKVESVFSVSKNYIYGILDKILPI